MQCPICDASISEIEAASTCPVCGVELAQTVFPPSSRILDDHGRTPRLSLISGEEFHDDSVSRRDVDDGRDYLAEVPDSGAIERHPSNPRTRRQEPRKMALPEPNFFCYKVHHKGITKRYWVRSHKKTPGRESLIGWLHGKGIVITDNLGHELPRSDGRALKMAIPLVGGPLAALPIGEKEYIDAYDERRVHPVPIRL